MQNGVYLFKNETDFIQAMNNLQKHYAKNNGLIQLSIEINSIHTLRDEIAILEKCYINTFNGFLRDKQIKVNLNDNCNNRYLITYDFSRNDSLYLYYKFRHYLRDRCG